MNWLSRLKRIPETGVPCSLALVLFLLLFSWPNSVYSQDVIDEIDLKDVRQKSIRKFIKDQQTYEVTRFSELQPSITTEDDLNDLESFSKQYVFKAEPEVVWRFYNYSNQTELWDISKISLGMIYDRNSETVYFSDDLVYGLRSGRLYFVKLKILRIISLPVAFEITRVDHENKQVEFSYLKGGKAMGKQVITLSETSKGYTKIIHQSYVSSNSGIRDKYLYPFFHNKLINEFHFNIRRTVKHTGKHHNMLAETN